MKTKGFTLVELLVACTLLLMLSTVSFTSAYNFVSATANLKAQSNSIQHIMALHTALAKAKLNYATDLAMIIAAGTPSKDSPAPTPQQVQQAKQAQDDITNWNSFAQGDNKKLIDLLINPDSNLPIPMTPPNPGSTSYISPPTPPVAVQITDITSLLKAYQLTDDGTTAGNVIATISVGPLVQSGAMIRPTLPTIDWKAGGVQEIQY